MSGKYKYNEDKALQAITEYLESTYDQHYVGDGDVQTVDFWRSLGSLETTARDTAIKYLARFGKKGGKNRKDLLKAMHYIILMMYALDLEKNEEDDYEGCALDSSIDVGDLTVTTLVSVDNQFIDSLDEDVGQDENTLSIDEEIHDDIQRGKIEAASHAMEWAKQRR